MVPDARALYREGFRHFAEDRIDEAIACYRSAVEAEPDLAIAWNGLSMTLRRKGDIDGAIEAGLKIAELEPNDPLSHTNLSRLLMQKGFDARNVSGGMLSRAYASFFLQDGALESDPSINDAKLLHRSGARGRKHAR